MPKDFFAPLQVFMGSQSEPGLEIKRLLEVDNTEVNALHSYALYDYF